MSVLASKPLFRDGLRISKLRAIEAELTGYRDYAPSGPGPKKGDGEVLPFVRGLYLSAKVIYFIRDLVRGMGLDVNWGHIIHNSQIYCSPECDIVIHKQGSVHNWNGDVLDFHFVDLSKVVAVVSCKSIVQAVDAEYCQKLKAFGVNNVLLFGEECSASNFKNLRQKAIDAGYTDFWCLALDDHGNRSCDENMLLEFIRFFETLKF